MKKLLNKAKSFKVETLVCRILAVMFILMGLIMANVSCSLNSVGIKGNGYLTVLLSLGSFACSIFLLDYSKYRVNVYEKAINSEDGYKIEIVTATILNEPNAYNVLVAKDPEGKIFFSTIEGIKES